MSITIELNAQQLNNTTQLELHYLPAKIEGDGPTNVKEYFNVYTRQLPGGPLTNALRGYPLQGEELQIPDGYQALVLQETRKPLDEEAERRLRITGTFEKFLYWNYDKLPTKADPYRQALQVLDISTALAKPVSAADVAAEIDRRKQQLAAKQEN